MTEIHHDDAARVTQRDIAELYAVKDVSDDHKFRMGLEYETLYHNRDSNLSIMSPDQSQNILQQIYKESGKGQFENKSLTTVQNGKSVISLEACGVLEIATNPFEIGQEKQLLQELYQQRDYLNHTAHEYNLHPCPFSSSPHVTLNDVENNLVHRDRLRAGYNFFKDNNSENGMMSMGLITSAQVSVEALPQHYETQIRTAFMLQPLLYALCSSHSGYKFGQSYKNIIRPDVYLSYNHIGHETSGSVERSGIPSFIFNGDKPIIESYADTVLNTPMLFHYDKNGQIVSKQLCLKDLQHHNPDLMTKTNLNAARSLLFYDVKIHQTESGSGQRLELRAPDSGHGNAEMAFLIARSTLMDPQGLQDTQLALKECGLLYSPYSDQKSLKTARYAVSQNKMKTAFGTKTLHHFAQSINEIAQGKLAHQGVDESLEMLNFTTQTGITNTAFIENTLGSLNKVVDFMGDNRPTLKPYAQEYFVG
jgi:gamma-glutamylcysteine synthetase